MKRFLLLLVTCSVLGGSLVTLLAQVTDLRIDADGNVLPAGRIIKLADGKLRVNGAMVDAIKPAPVPSSSIAIGEFTSLVSDGAHNAFGDDVYIPSAGKLIDIYRAGSSHTSADGVLKQKISTDGGITFGAAVTIYNDTANNNDSRDSAVSLLPDGRLAVSFFKTNSVSGLSSVFVMFSSDNGATYGTPIAVGVTMSNNSAACSSRVVWRRDGALLLAAYGLRNSGDTKHSSVLYVSTNGGTSWSLLSTIAAGTSTTQYNETWIDYLPDAFTLMAFIRNDLPVNGKTMRSISTDGGATWSTPTDTGLVCFGGRPAWTKTLSGAILTHYRLNVAGVATAAVAVSVNNGLSFGPAIVIPGAAGATPAYGGFTHIGRNMIALAGFSETSLSVSSAYLQFFSDGVSVTPIGGLVGSLSRVLDVNGKTILAFTPAGSSAVNYLTLGNQVTTATPSLVAPSLVATGSDTDIGINLQPKANAPLTLVNTSNNPALRFRGSGTIPNYSAITFGPPLTTDTFGSISKNSGSTGGLALLGFTTASGSAATNALVLSAYHGNTLPTVGALLLQGKKFDGTSNSTALAASEPVIDFNNNAARIGRWYGDGGLYIGATPSDPGASAIKSEGDSSSKSYTATGTAGAGFLRLQTQSSAPAAPGSNNIDLFSDSAGRFSWKRSDGFIRKFDSTLTADRIYTFPDADTKMPILGQTLTFSGPTAARTYTLPDANKTLLETDGNGASLTNLNASNIASGNIADARQGTNVTLQTNTFNAANKLVQLDSAGKIPGALLPPTDSLVVPWDMFPGRTGNSQATGTGASANSSNEASIAGMQPSVEVISGTTTTGGAAYYLTAAANVGNARGSLRTTNFTSLELTMYVRLPTLSDGTDTFKVVAGFVGLRGDASSAASNGAYLSITGSSLNVVGNSSSTETTVTSGTTLLANTWYKLRLVWNIGTGVTGYLNDVSFGTVSTGLPSGIDVIPQIYILKSAGTTSRTAYFARGYVIAK